MGMGRTAHSESGRTEHSGSSRLFKNTFAPNCRNEYFTESEILGLCKTGFPADRLPKDAREAVDKMTERHVEKSKDADSQIRRIDRMLPE